VELGVDKDSGLGGAARNLANEFSGSEFSSVVGSSSGGGEGGGGGSVPSLSVARNLLTKFAFPSSRWNDEVRRERRHAQLLRQAHFLDRESKT
jgi:hypothetical protein